MANLTETPSYDAGVYQIAKTDPVSGYDSVSSAAGIANAPTQNLANRTAWLKAQIASLTTSLAGLAPINTPVFTGNPQAPSPPAGDSSQSLATTSWIKNFVRGVAVVNCTGSGGNTNVTLTAAQAGCAVIYLQGASTGNLTVFFPGAGKWTIINGTTGATYAAIGVTGGSATQGSVATGYFGEVYCDGTNVFNSPNDLPDAYLRKSVNGAGPIADAPSLADNTARIITSAWFQSFFYSNTIFAQNGAITLPGGLIIQWGNGSTITGNQDTVTFAKPFKTLLFGVAALEANAAGWGGPPPAPSIYGTSRSAAQPLAQFQISASRIGTTGVPSYVAGSAYFYIAIGA